MTTNTGGDPTGPGRVVVLNGPSSSGKSRLSAALQDRVDGVWFALGIDTLTAAVAERFAAPGYPFRPDEFRDLGRGFAELEDAFVVFVADLARRGVNVVVDTVFQQGQQSAARWRTELEGADPLFVGLYAPDNVLEARAVARGDRAPGLASAQAAVVHADVDYDHVFDTSATGPDHMVAVIARALGADLRPDPPRGG